ncbi:hypothetical protein EPN95_02125 [Patescibacteria group bacterium]|nr:MAG: hypothetical protein EPN95_02125 [Patescibacteria group bacterium]
MFQLFLNPLPILLTLAASFGVLFHDTQVDHAATSALALPSSFASYGGADVAIKLSDPHVHTESFSVANNIEQLHSGQPRTQTRGDEDKKYISVKKFVSDGMGSEYHWPSA